MIHDHPGFLAFEKYSLRCQLVVWKIRFQGRDSVKAICMAIIKRSENILDLWDSERRALCHFWKDLHSFFSVACNHLPVPCEQHLTQTQAQEFCLFGRLFWTPTSACKGKLFSAIVPTSHKSIVFETCCETTKVSWCREMKGDRPTPRLITFQVRRFKPSPVWPWLK